MTDRRIDSIHILTEAEAAEFLRMEEKTLRNLRYRKKIGHLRRGYYLQKHLDDFIDSQEVLCGENPSSSSDKILRFGASMSPSREDSERSALIRAKQIIARQNSSLRNGFSKEKNPSLPH